MAQASVPAAVGHGADEFRLDGYVALVTGAGRGIHTSTSWWGTVGKNGRQYNYTPPPCSFPLSRTPYQRGTATAGGRH